MFLLNMSFIALEKWTIIIFHSWLRHSWNINIVHFTREIKDIFNKNIWISSIYLKATIFAVWTFSPQFLFQGYIWWCIPSPLRQRTISKAVQVGGSWLQVQSSKNSVSKILQLEKDSDIKCCSRLLFGGTYCSRLLFGICRVLSLHRNFRDQTIYLHYILYVSCGPHNS